MYTLIRIILAFIITMLAYSCVNLKHVNDFSSSSLAGIKNFNEVKYSFETNCTENCKESKINNLDINNLDCDCEFEKKADSVTLKVYNSVHGYFDGLTKLSDNELINFKIDDLESALIEGDFGSVTIEDKQVESYSKISKILLKAFTDSYRKGKLKSYIKEANTPLIELISYLDLNLYSNLNGKLNIRKQTIESQYFDLIEEGNLTPFQKRQTIQEYYDKINEIEKKQDKLLTYSKSLKKISKGHQELSDNIEAIKTKEVKQILFKYASEIETIISEFKKIRE